MDTKGYGFQQRSTGRLSRDSFDRYPNKSMTQIKLYEEAMCCSTGVCGPDPDDELVELSAALDQLEDEFETAEISRANMQHNIDEFLNTEEIYDLVQENGPEILPITTVDGEIVAKEEYLSYNELAVELRSSQPQEAH
jgi:hypothetical protein